MHLERSRLVHDERVPGPGLGRIPRAKHGRRPRRGRRGRSGKRKPGRRENGLHGFDRSRQARARRLQGQDEGHDPRRDRKKENGWQAAVRAGSGASEARLRLVPQQPAPGLQGAPRAGARLHDGAVADPREQGRHGRAPERRDGHRHEIQGRRSRARQSADVLGAELQDEVRFRHGPLHARDGRHAVQWHGKAVDASDDAARGSAPRTRDGQGPHGQGHRGRRLRRPAPGRPEVREPRGREPGGPPRADRADGRLLRLPGPEPRQDVPLVARDPGRLLP